MFEKSEYCKLPGPSRLIVFLSMIVWDALTPRKIRELSGPENGISSQMVAETFCQSLQRKGWLNYDKRSRRYALAGCLPLETAREIVREADAAGWWPKLSVWMASVKRENRSYRSWADEDDARHHQRCAELLGWLVRGSAKPCAGGEDVFEKAPPRMVSEAARAAAMLAFRRVVSLGPLGSEGQNGKAFDEVLADYLSLAFLSGLDVQALTASLAARFAEVGGKPERVLAENFLALGAWCGKTDWLDLPGLRNFSAFGSACKALCDGDAASADKFFRGMFEMDRKRPSDLDNVPVRALMWTACCAAKPDKVPKTRPSQVLRAGISAGLIDWEDETAVHAYEGIVCRASINAAESWRAVATGSDSLFRREVSADDLSILSALAYAWSWRTLLVRRAACKAAAHAFVAPFCKAKENGYLNLAGLGLSLLTGCYEEAEAAEAVSAVTTQGAWFIPRVEPEPDWKGMVDSLRTVLVKSEKKAAKKQTTEARKLYWGVELESPDAWGNQQIVDVKPFLRKPGCKPGGTNEELLSLDDGDRAKYKGVFSEKDRQLLVHLQASKDYYAISVHVNEAILSLLADLDNLENRQIGRYYDLWERKQRNEKVTPMTIVRGSVQLASKVLEDGGVDFGLPDWLIETSSSLIVRKKADEEVYQYFVVGEEVGKVRDFFRQFGEKGRLVFPRESLAASSDVIDRLTTLIPVAVPSEQDMAGLTRVAAKADVAVRLDYDGGTCLVVRAVVQPIPENATLVFDPGQGVAEKVVSGLAGSYVLVRDLAAEKAAFTRVETALEGCSDWFDGRATWTIDDIPAAIEALSALKALEPAVPLEWVDQHRLDVAFAPKSGVQMESTRTAEEWFSVKGSFTLDTGRVLNVLELLAALPTRAGRYVRLTDGAYVSLTRTMLREMEALAAAGRRKGGALEIPRAALPMLDKAFDATDGEGVALPEAMAKSAEEIRSVLARRPSVPKTLQAELRTYQVDGYRWLSRLAACGFGACLADDMGLGKTLQVIALLLERAGDGPSLVVAPASVCGNWRREIQRFAPTLAPVLAMERDDAGASAGPFEVVIASYGYLLFHEQALVSRSWNGLVLDEAQAIKNDASKRAHLVKRFSARFRVAATGTPVENRLGELWSLFDFLNPGLLGPAASFAQRFTVEGKAKPELKKLVKPLILRRLKGDVLDDLPEKTEITLSVNLGSVERSAYEGCRLHALAALEEKDEEDRISILAELTRLRRFCCHPSLVLGASDVPSAKMEAVVDLLGELREGHHRALVFSQFTDYLTLVRRVVEAHGWTYKYLDGSTPTLERERLVNAFQSGEGDFFLISLKAGGTGLNLTAANYVILLDPWWNPAVENQAADRAHRIGQTQPVTIYRLVAADTVEERVIELHKEKNAMAADLLEGTSNTSFTSKDLMNLFR